MHIKQCHLILYALIIVWYLPCHAISAHQSAEISGLISSIKSGRIKENDARKKAQMVARWFPQSAHSSDLDRLQEVAEKKGIPAILDSRVTAENKYELLNIPASTERSEVGPVPAKHSEVVERRQAQVTLEIPKIATEIVKKIEDLHSRYLHVMPAQLEKELVHIQISVNFDELPATAVEQLIILSEYVQKGIIYVGDIDAITQQAATIFNTYQEKTGGQATLFEKIEYETLFKELLADIQLAKSEAAVQPGSLLDKMAQDSMHTINGYQQTIGDAPEPAKEIGINTITDEQLKEAREVLHNMYTDNGYQQYPPHTLLLFTEGVAMFQDYFTPEEKKQFKIIEMFCIVLLQADFDIEHVDSIVTHITEQISHAQAIGDMAELEHVQISISQAREILQAITQDKVLMTSKYIVEQVIQRQETLEAKEHELISLLSSDIQQDLYKANTIIDQAVHHPEQLTDAEITKELIAMLEEEELLAQMKQTAQIKQQETQLHEKEKALLDIASQHSKDKNKPVDVLMHELVPSHKKETAPHNILTDQLLYAKELEHLHKVHTHIATADLKKAFDTLTTTFHDAHVPQSAKIYYQDIQQAIVVGGKIKDVALEIKNIRDQVAQTTSQQNISQLLDKARSVQQHIDATGAAAYGSDTYINAAGLALHKAVDQIIHDLEQKQIAQKTAISEIPSTTNGSTGISAEQLEAQKSKLKHVESSPHSTEGQPTVLFAGQKFISKQELQTGKTVLKPGTRQAQISNAIDELYMHNAQGISVYTTLDMDVLEAKLDAIDKLIERSFPTDMLPEHGEKIAVMKEYVTKKKKGLAEKAKTVKQTKELTEEEKSTLAGPGAITYVAPKALYTDLSTVVKNIVTESRKKTATEIEAIYSKYMRNIEQLYIRPSAHVSYKNWKDEYKDQNRKYLVEAIAYVCAYKIMALNPDIAGTIKKVAENIERLDEHDIDKSDIEKYIMQEKTVDELYTAIEQKIVHHR